MSRTPKATTNLIRIQVQVSNEQDDKLIALSDETGASKAWLVREAINMYLEKRTVRNQRK